MNKQNKVQINKEERAKQDKFAKEVLKLIEKYGYTFATKLNFSEAGIVPELFIAPYTDPNKDDAKKPSNSNK